MKLPGALGRLFAPKTVDDSVFGSIEQSSGFWIGEAVFPKGGAPTQVMIHADENGPT